MVIIKKLYYDARPTKYQDLLVLVYFVSFISNRNISCSLSPVKGTCSLSTNTVILQKEGGLKKAVMAWRGLHTVCEYLQYDYMFCTAKWECLSLGGTWCMWLRKNGSTSCDCESIQLIQCGWIYAYNIKEHSEALTPVWFHWHWSPLFCKTADLKRQKV